MLVVKYKKTDAACYVSHIDTLRTVGRIFGRANFEVNYSEGFNPHMLTFFSPPNAVGVESLCEYVAVSAKYADDFLQRFNDNAPAGFVAEKLWQFCKNPNLAKEINSAEYLFKCKDIGKFDLQKLIDATEFIVEYKDKNGVKQKDYKNYVLSLEVADDDAIKAKLKFGNENLRPDRFLSGFQKFFDLPKQDCKITKTQVYVNDKTADDFLNNFEK